jgi:hypothetical protein
MFELSQLGPALTVPARSFAGAALAVAALLLPVSAAHAQQQDGQLWLQTNENLPIAAGTRLTFEQIARFSDRQGGLYTTEFGALLSRRVGAGVELGFGYRRVSFHNRNNGADEDRVRQQVVVTHGPVMLRLRLDERFHPGGDEIGFRIRPLVRLTQPLGRRGLALFASHESFYLPNSTSWGQRSGYERMRNSIGLSFPLGRMLAADVGYLNQFRPGRGGARAQMDHALSLQLTLNLGQVGHHSKADD